MNKLIYIVAMLAVSLTGCFHHKRNLRKYMKSKEKSIYPNVHKEGRVHPDIQRYHDDKRKYEGIKVVEIPLQKNEEKDEMTRQEIVNSGPLNPDNPHQDKKKPEKTWWFWD